MPRPERALDRLADGLATGLAARSTRRSFLGRVGAWLLAVTGGSLVAAAVRPGEAEGFHFCGHIFTTGSCPSPYPPLSRIDRQGLPLHPEDGSPIDNLGRRVNAKGYPVDEQGRRLRGPDGRALGRAPRTRICEDWIPESHGIQVVTQGAWYRCCHGQVRKLTDCCTRGRRRINGDAALVGYCWGGHRVFCVMYYDTGMPC